MGKQRRIDLEDQTLSGIVLKDGELRLHIDCRDPDAGTQSKVLAVFSGIRNLSINGKPAAFVAMESNDGEIIHFETDDNHMLLIVIWHEYQPKTQETKSYKFDFDRMYIGLQ